MQYRILGKTGWKVSAVSMGCWGLGGQWGPVAERQAIDTVQAALDAGVNLFDTADAYGMGISEEYLGKALKGKRDDVYIATKVGNWGRRFNDAAPYNSIYSILECCHASLHRLGIECIDLYQCHIPRPEKPEVFVEAFEMLKKQGKIRHYAISTNDVESTRAINIHGGCAACQVNYSMATREAEADILPYCLENNIGVLLRGPLRRGVLTGKFGPDHHFEDSVRQHWNEGEDHELFVETVQRTQQLRERIGEDRSLLELALQFTLAHPAVTCPIPGMKSPEQARSNAAAADGALTTEEKRIIDEIFPPQA